LFLKYKRKRLTLGSKLRFESPKELSETPYLNCPKSFEEEEEIKEIEEQVLPLQTRMKENIFE